MHGKMPSFTIIRLAKAGMGKDKEALDDFVLEAPSDYLDNFASPEDALQSLLDEEEMDDDEGDDDLDNVIGQVKDAMKMVRSGSIDPDALRKMLEGFMEYLGEPAKVKRKNVGIWVLLFLALFALIAYLLKAEYWRDVH